MLTDEQKIMLAADLDRKNVRQRAQSGRQLSYIESWHAIAEANRILGFDGWTSETVEIKCVAEKEREIGVSKSPGWGVSYIARVRVTVGNVVREGCGAGHGIDRDLGQAHESALKEAESDARKRALMTFGNPFGLALYDKEQAHVSDGDTPKDAETYVAAAIKAMGLAKNETDLVRWWNGEKKNRDMYQLMANEGPGLRLVTAYKQRKASLQSELMGAG